MIKNENKNPKEPSSKQSVPKGRALYEISGTCSFTQALLSSWMKSTKS